MCIRDRGTGVLPAYHCRRVVPGADQPTFTPTAAQRRTRLSVAVVATKKGYADGTATSSRTRKVKPGTLTTLSAPAVAGTAQVDQVLTASRGSYEPRPEQTSLQWYADGTPVPGATTARLRLTPELVGACLLYTSPSPRDATLSRMPSSA